MGGQAFPSEYQSCDLSRGNALTIFWRPHGNGDNLAGMNRNPLFLLAGVLFAGMVLAQAGDRGAIRGVVSVVVGGTVTVATDTQGEMSYGLTDKTEVVKLDGKPGSVQDLGAGVVVEITPGSDANVASRIRIVPPRESEKQ